MNEQDKMYLNGQLEIIQEIQDEFFTFSTSTEVQLLTNQLQFFQSLAAISLTVVSVLLGTNSVRFTWWWFSTGAMSVFLVIFTSVVIRETVDEYANDLKSVGRDLGREHKRKIEEAIESADISIYKSYQSEVDKRAVAGPTPVSYEGEITVFLFLLVICLAIVAALDQYFCLPILISVLLFLLGTFACFLLAMYDWSKHLTRRLSECLDIILRKSSKIGTKHEPTEV